MPQLLLLRMQLRCFIVSTNSRNLRTFSVYKFWPSNLMSVWLIDLVVLSSKNASSHNSEWCFLGLGIVHVQWMAKSDNLIWCLSPVPENLSSLRRTVIFRYSSWNQNENIAPLGFFLWSMAVFGGGRQSNMPPVCHFL